MAESDGAASPVSLPIDESAPLRPEEEDDFDAVSPSAATSRRQTTGKQEVRFIASSSVPAKRQEILLHDVLEAVVHTSGYVLGIIFYKAITAQRPGGGNSAATTAANPADNSSSPTAAPDHDGISREFRFGFLNAMRADFTVPLFCNIVANCVHFCVASLYILVMRDEAVSHALSAPGAPARAAKQGEGTFFGLPYLVLVVTAILGSLVGATYLLTFLYLPITVAESIMMTGPAVSILLSSLLQPNVKYNFWIWASVFPLVLGGIFVSAFASALDEKDPASTGAKTNGVYLVGILWAMASVVCRALRIIVIDVVVGQYEKKLAEQELLEALQEDDGAVEDGTQVGRVVATTTSQQGLQGSDSQAARTSAKSEHPFPSAVRILQLVLPFNIVLTIALSLLFERTAYSPFVQTRREAGGSAAATNAPDEVNGGDSWWLPISKIQHLAPDERTNMFLGLFCFSLFTGLWILTEFRLVQTCGSYTVAIFANLNRGGAALVAIAVLDERVTGMQILGICLIIGGLAMKFLLGEASVAADPAPQPALAGHVTISDHDQINVEEGQRLLAGRRGAGALLLPPLPGEDAKDGLGDREISMMGTNDGLAFLGRQISAAGARNRELSRQLSAGTGAVPRQYSAVTMEYRQISAPGGTLGGRMPGGKE